MTAMVTMMTCPKCRRQCRASRHICERILVAEWWEAHGKRYPTKSAVRDVCVAHYIRVRRYRLVRKAGS